MTSSAHSPEQEFSPELAPDSLNGVSLYVDPMLAAESFSLRWDALRESDHVWQVVRAAENAGASIVESASIACAPDPENAYMFACLYPGAPNKSELQATEDLGIRRPRTLPLPAIVCGKDIELPFVLANSYRDGGVEKFFVETDEQFAVVTRFASEIPHRRRKNYELREFIATPSDRYTSYRVLVDGGGNVLASGLLYSQQTKHATTTIAGPPIAPQSRFEDSISLFTTFTDIRSNLSTGGTVIPLMGRYAQPPKRRYEAQILEAHGINPSQPETPTDVLEQARIIGELVCKRSGLVVGVDFLADADQNNEPVFLEYNGWPGAKTFHACHYQNEPFEHTVHHPRMYTIGLAMLALRRNS